MNFCQNYFSKDLDQLTESDLVAFFSTPQKETQYIEFKSSGETNVEQVFNKTLKPAVCSFLNSEGGILIYGAPREDRRNLENPENFKLRPYPPKFLGDHDSIIRKIADGITPMPIGVRLKEVEVEAGMVAVFEIQESLSKPHQTDNIYQIRIDGQKKPAPHYLIEAMMKQIRFPNIESYVLVMKNEFLSYNSDILSIKLEVMFFNFSEYLNEKNIRYSYFIEGDMGFNTESYLKFSVVRNFSILTSGDPESHYVEIFGNFGFIKNEKIVDFGVVFSGDSCPPKITVYRLKIVPHNFRGILENSSGELIVNNILLTEYQKSKGLINKEAILRDAGINI